MRDIPASEAIADLQFGMVKTLQVICEQLLYKGLLDRELLLSDLVQAQAEISAKASLAGAVASGLYAVLGGPRLGQSQ